MKFGDLRNWFRGEDAVVVGCGPSSGGGGPRWTFGCNRAANDWSTDFGICVEPARDPAWKSLKKTATPFVFTHQPVVRGRGPHPRMVQVPGTDVTKWFEPFEGDRLWLGQSPFYGAAVAAYLGFETVGLIGVDLTEDRYPDAARPSKAYCRLRDLLEQQGTRLVNLSPASRLEGIEKADWDVIRSKWGSGEPVRN